MAINQVRWIETPDGNKYQVGGDFYYIAGTGSTAGTWLGSHASITEYYDGLTVAYKIPVAGANPTTLNINSLGAKTVYRNGSSKITTHYGAGTVVVLTYISTGSYPGWHCADYDSNSDAKTTAGNTSSKIFLIGATSQSTTGVTTYSHDTVYVGTDGCLYSNSKKVLTDHDGNDNQTIKGNGVAFGNNDAVDIVGSTNISVTGDSSTDKITIALQGTIPASMLPSYVDDVIEGYYNASKFYTTYSNGSYSGEITGEAGKIYVDLNTNKTYRWSGSAYVEISSSLAIGSTGSSAAAGNHVHTIPSHTHSITKTTGTVYSITDPGTLPSLTTEDKTVSKITSWTAGSAPKRSSFTYVDGVKSDGTVSVLTGVGGETATVVTGVTSNGTATVVTGVTSNGTASAVTGITRGSGSLQVYSSDSATTAETLPTSGRIAVVTDVSHDISTTSTTVLTGVKASSTSSAAPNEHTHTYDKTTGIGLSANSSNATGYITYVQSISGGSASGTGAGSAAPNAHTHTVTVKGTTGANSGSAVTVATGSVSSTGTGATVATGSSGTATVLTGVKASGTNTSVDSSWSAGVLTLTERTFVTGVASNGTATAITGISTSKLVTSSAAPNAHTHSYGSDTALTTSTNSGSAVSTISGVSYTAPSATTRYLSASPSHTSTNTGKNSGNAVAAVTAVSSNGTTTVLTGVSGTPTVTKKYLLHTHTASSSSGSATVLKGVKASGTTTVLTGVKASGTVDVLKSVSANGTATVIKSDGLSTSTAYSITSLGSASSLSYEEITIKSVDEWSAGTLPTKGSAQTVVTSVTSPTGGTSLTTNTPS